MDSMARSSDLKRAAELALAGDWDVLMRLLRATSSIRTSVGCMPVCTRSKATPVTAATGTQKQAGRFDDFADATAELQAIRATIS